MKVRIVFIVSTLLLIVAAWWFFKDSKETPKPAPAEAKVEPDFQTVEVANFSVLNTAEATGTLVPMKSVAVSFAVGGTLEQGERALEQGMKFSKNQLLFQVNNEQAFLQMLAVKKELKKNLTALLPQIKTQFPLELEKWNAFVATIEPGSLLQELPAMKSREEQQLMKQHQIQEDHAKIRAMESGMAAFFYLAPFDGTLIEINAKPGKTIAKGQTIARISPKGSLQVKCQLEQVAFNAFDSFTEIALFQGSKKVGTAKILNTAPNPENPALQDLYLTVPAKENLQAGAEVAVHFSGKSKPVYFKVPASAVKSGKVSVLAGANAVEQNVSVIRQEKDSLLLTGLKNGDKLILN